MLTQHQLSIMAAEHGFSAASCCAPLPEDGAPQEVRALLLLARFYIPGGRLVDAFYPASNAAYHEAKALTEEISGRFGVKALQLPQVRLKPLCARLPAFARGMNTLSSLPGQGSRFCLELLGISEPVEIDEELPAQAALPCAACRRCRDACPTGAITETGFVRERCIRHHMLSGKPMPEEMRPYIGTKTAAIVGCDLCQRACPANAQIEAQRQEEDRFTLDELLVCDDETMREFARLYGSNYAIRNRVLAQAALAAGNTGEEKYRPALERLADSASPTVAEHARWALRKLDEMGQMKQK